MKIEISAKCPVCGKISKHSYDKDAYNKYIAGEDSIQSVFPNEHPMDRELLLTGMCHDCCEDTFGTPAPEHETEWGKCVGECDCCGRPVYEKDVKEGTFRCKSCGNDSYDVIQ